MNILNSKKVNKKECVPVYHYVHLTISYNIQSNINIICTNITSSLVIYIQVTNLLFLRCAIVRIKNLHKGYIYIVYE